MTPTEQRLREALQDIVDFCDDPNGSEGQETLALGLARLLPEARNALAQTAQSAAAGEKSWRQPVIEALHAGVELVGELVTEQWHDDDACLASYQTGFYEALDAIGAPWFPERPAAAEDDWDRALTSEELSMIDHAWETHKASGPQHITEAQIKHMVQHFLGWKLPANFSPDAGISFKAEFNEHTDHPMCHEPSGTNLFDATQAEEMVRYMIAGMPAPASPPEGEK